MEQLQTDWWLMDICAGSGDGDDDDDDDDDDRAIEATSKIDETRHMSTEFHRNLSTQVSVHACSTSFFGVVAVAIYKNFHVTFIVPLTQTAFQPWLIFRFLRFS